MRRSDDSSELTEVLDLIDPELFLEYEGVDFRRTFGSSGAQLNLKECPRCGGASWKVYLNAETGLGNCFHGACVGEPGFNLFSFARHLWGANPRDTIHRLKEYAKEQGWMAKRVTSVDVAMNDDVELPESVLLPYKGHVGAYLSSRGITAEIARYFHLRYCQQGQYFYYDGTGRRRWQNYDKRIIIPVFDLDGDLVTFQGRDVTGTFERKYLFPAGLPGTARFLYNGQNVRGCKELVLCEGAIDVWSSKMALDDDVTLRSVGHVGSFGKHLSHGSKDGSDQLGALLQLKREGLKRVVIMWDGESGALRSAIDAGKRIRSIDLECDIALLPAGKDPNECTAEEVRRAYYSAVSSNSARVIREISKRRVKK